VALHFESLWRYRSCGRYVSDADAHSEISVLEHVDAMGYRYSGELPKLRTLRFNAAEVSLNKSLLSKFAG
jgi:hypothetical protein